MQTLKQKPAIDKAVVPLVNRLLSKFPENYCPDDIMQFYREKYSVYQAQKYLLEMFLRIDRNSDLLKVSIKDLDVFMEDTCNLLMAVYVWSEEKNMRNNVEEQIHLNAAGKE